MTEAAKTTTTKKPAPKAEAPKPAPKVEAKDRPAPRGNGDLMENVFSYGLLAALAAIFAYSIYALI
jgi:hypothetical protein